MLLLAVVYHCGNGSVIKQFVISFFFHLFIYLFNDS